MQKKYLKKEVINVGETLRIYKYYYRQGLAIYFDVPGKEVVRVWVGILDIGVVAESVKPVVTKA